jgi:adenylate kinase family enzyme
MKEKAEIAPAPKQTMRRIAMLGIPGGGKSTLGRRMAAALGLPLHQTDRMLFGRDWNMDDRTDFNARHEKILARDQWIIEGLHTLESLERRCDEADTLILIDLPEWRHHWWTCKRRLKHLFRHNPDLPDACTRWPSCKAMFLLIQTTRREQLPYLQTLLRERPLKTQFVLRSPRDIREFCRENLAPPNSGSSRACVAAARGPFRAEPVP